MAKKMLIDATHLEETRVVVVDGNKVDDFDFESINKRQLAGNIYLAKVTRVEPSLQAAFVDYGGNRHGFLAFAEVHPDYYQIPVADREALIAEEAALAKADAENANRGDNGDGGAKGRRRRGGRGRSKAGDEAATASSGEIAGFGVIEPEGELPGEEAGSDAVADLAVSDVGIGAETTQTPGTDDAETGVAATAAGEDAASADSASAVETVASGPAETATDGETLPDNGGSTEIAAESSEASRGQEGPVPVETAADDTAAAAVSEASAVEDEASETTAEEETPTDEPPAPPRSIAESAGLGDEDDVVRGDVPVSPRRPDEAGDEDNAAVSAEPAEAPATTEEPSTTPASPATDAADVSPEDAGAHAADQPAPEDAGSVVADDVAAEPAADPAAATGDGEATTEGADAEAADAQSGSEGEGPTRRSRSRRRRRSKTATADAAEGEASEDAAKAEARSDEDAESGEEEGASPAKVRRSRRGGRSRSRGKGGDDDADQADVDGESDSEEDEQDEVDTVGAEDLREEDLAARAIRRRRYKIQDVIKSRQIMLVQVVKEERGTKGAALTTYLSLAGRYCVLMPNTARGGGISRKITNATDRKRLREIVGELEVPEGMGLIVRTAGAERTRAEIKRDYEFLLRQWEQVRSTTLESSAPCLIYEEGSLIKRAIRDLYNKEIDTVLVEGEDGYREAKDYMKMLMPSHARHVQQYSDTTPLFIRYQVESYLNGMFSPTVQLKSGGYIVIGVTEALVAIDVNSGRSTREGSIEETAVKTNLEAADEVARQLRLRDLAGLIVIDFIDMDESRNNRAVEKRMKDRLKHDRARIQVGRISAFGLMEMSRQRLRPGMLEATTKPCPHCHGQGLIRSDESMALGILREIEEEGVKGRSAGVVATMPVEICNYIVNSKRAHLAGIEERYGLSVQLLGDPSLTSPEYSIERAKGAQRPERPAEAIVSASSLVEEALAEDAVETAEETEAPADGDGRGGEDAGGGKKRRRGRRGGRRRRGTDEAGAAESAAGGDGSGGESADEDAEVAASDRPEAGGADAEAEGRSKRRRGRGRKRDDGEGDSSGSRAAEAASLSAEEVAGAEHEGAAAAETAEESAEAIETPVEAEAAAADPPAEPASADSTTGREEPAPEESGAAEEAVAEPVMAEAVAAAPERDAEKRPEETADTEAKPKRRGWWSLRR